MPVYKDLKLEDGSRVLVWKVGETEEELISGISFCPHSLDRLSRMKSGIHRRAFASIRYLFRELGYADGDIVYNGAGKPSPRDGTYISITHSGIFTALVHSRDRPVGIDIEQQRPKILRIANKFTRFHHTFPAFATGHEDSGYRVRVLTAVWGVKESIYKLYGEKGLSFLDHITAEEVAFEKGRARATVEFRQERRDFEADFLEFEDYTCVWVIGS